jgi:hypothetical protein
MDMFYTNAQGCQKVWHYLLNTYYTLTTAKNHPISLVLLYINCSFTIKIDGVIVIKCRYLKIMSYFLASLSVGVEHIRWTDAWLKIKPVPLMILPTNKFQNVWRLVISVSHLKWCKVHSLCIKISLHV